MLQREFELYSNSKQSFEPLKQIVYQASRLHQENPSLYGIKNASPGNKGYVPNG